MNNPFDRFMRNYLFILSLIIVLNGCRKPSAELLYIDDLLKTKPDSALKFLETKGVDSYTSDLDKAFYGLLYYTALDKNDKLAQNDYLIDFSINYFHERNQKKELARSYYYKARYLKKNQKFEDATKYYFKSLDLLKNSHDDYYLGKIYADLGSICGLQKEEESALEKYKLAFKCFKRANETIESALQLVDIGREYKFLKNEKKAFYYFRKAIKESAAPIVLGYAYQDLGVLFYKMGKLDSAFFYIKNSLKYPYRGNCYSIRCNMLASIYYDFNQYDSAIYYSTKALNYPTTFYNQRECYRILANSEYYLGDFDKMGEYLWKYQEYTDSVRNLETQTKSVVIEDFNEKSEETAGAKNDMILNTTILMLLTLFVSYLAYFYYRRTRKKKEQLDFVTEQLNSKQVFLNQNILKRLNEMRLFQSVQRKNASPEEKVLLDKELYEKSLHVSNWEAFSCEMNHTFNNVVDVLEQDYSMLNRKEIIWCCLELLDIPTNDRVLLLDSTPEAIYKLKQRIARKLDLKNTRELNLFLKRLSTAKI